MTVNVLSRKAMLAQLSISRWGARRFDDVATNEVLDKHSAKRDVGLFTKRLLAKPAMAEIHRVTAQARAYHHEHTSPWLDDGIRILPNVFYMTYAAKLGEFDAAFWHAVAEFVRQYPKFVEEARIELGSLFVANDYPKASRIKERFSFGVVILPCPDSSDFRSDLDTDVLDDIKTDMNARMEQQLRLTMKDTAERIVETVGHMAERLKAYKPGDKAKGKKTEGHFRDSLVEHVRDLAELLPAFNLADDPRLTAIHKRIMEELCPHEADALREDARKRKRVQASAEQILKDVSTFLT